jgi:uncharacterized membrane protein YhaH (DUF805 family)
MPFLAFLYLLLLFLLSGYGILQLFGLRLNRVYTITLSLLLGVALASFLPFLMQLCYVPLTAASIFGVLAMAATLLSIPVWMRVRKEGIGILRADLLPRRFRIQPYEIPYWMIVGFLIFVSVWRCYYLPPTSRDALSGPEAIAQVAVREHTLINSFFKVDLWSTNNQFKSPFLICLQLIYKLAGFPFGQIWLSIVFICFTIFLYHALQEKLHPLIAGVLMLIFLMTPEMYAYTFMILYDYSNTVFFFLGLYFLFKSFHSGDKRYFYFSGLLMGIATYIRSETLAFALLFLPPMLLAQRRARLPWAKMAVGEGFYYLPSLIGYILPTQIWINYYLPVHYDVGGLVNTHLSDLSPLFQRYSDIVTHLIFSEFGIHLWCYFFYILVVLFLAEALLVRRFHREARNWLYALAIFYIGLGALGWLLPVIDLNDTTKRALFKILPVGLFYLGNNELLLRLSRSISRWEALPWSSRPAGAAGGKQPVAARTVLTKSGKTVAAAGGAKQAPGSRQTPAAGAPKQPPASGKRKRHK